jgi:hypothetical protein
MLGAAGMMPASAYHADPADEYEHQVGRLYSEDDPFHVGIIRK